MLSPVLLTTLAAVGGGIAVPLRAAARRHAPVGLRRPACAGLAVALLAIAVVSPLATLAAHYLLTAHLVQVTLLMGFVPPLLLLALPAAPRPRLPGPLLGAGRVVTHPAIAIVLVNAVFFGWHAPALYDACLEHSELYGLQLVTLLGASLAFWWPIVEPYGPGRWSMGNLIKLGYILLATLPQTFAGLLFALAHHSFYPPYTAAPSVFGLSHATDQQVAGACMALISKLALFAAFSIVLWRVLDPTADDEQEGGDDGGGGRRDKPLPVPPGLPVWVRLLQSRTVDEPSPSRRPAAPGARR